MSTLKTINIVHPSSPNTNIVLDANGNANVFGTINATAMFVNGVSVTLGSVLANSAANSANIYLMTYANTVANGVNTTHYIYANTVANGVNTTHYIYANTVANGVNNYANVVSAAANSYANIVSRAANNWANTSTAYIVENNVTTLITTGYTVQSFNAGSNIAAYGTWTPNATNSNYQYVTCNGAVTVAVPAANSAIDILWYNAANRNPGSVTFTGYQAQTGGGGDVYDTTAGNEYLLMIRRINGVSTYTWKALQ